MRCWRARGSAGGRRPRWPARPRRAPQPTRRRARATSTTSSCRGGGPAGPRSRLLAERHGVGRVALVDPQVEAPWPNNYGVWRDEGRVEGLYPELDLKACLNAEWAHTDRFFGGSWGVPEAERTRIPRCYARVDRGALRGALRARPA